MNPDKLADLINATEEAILAVESDGTIAFANQPAQQMFHESQASVVGTNFNDLIDPKAAHQFKKGIKSIQSNPDEVVYFNTTRQQEGGKNTRIRIIKSNTGNAYLVTAICIDKYEPRNVYQLYKLLAENAYDINLMYEGEELIFVSPSIFDFLGYADHEFKTLEDWYALFHPEDLPKYKQEIDNDVKNNLPFSFLSYRQKHKKGHYLWFETKIKREYREDGSFINILTSMDVSQRKNAEDELERQKEFIEELFDTDPNLIFVKDAMGNIIYCNKAVADLVGMPRDKFLALQKNPFPASEHQAEAYAEMEQKVISQGQEVLIEEKIEDKNGIVNHFQTLKKPLKTKNGDINILNISTNINKIKYYQNESQKAMKAKDEFFSALSHEIRTPMNAIMGLTDLLLKRKPREDQVKLIQTLHFSSKNLISMINDILDFSKIEAGKIELESINFNLKELIDNIHLSLKPKALSKNLTLGLSVDDSVPEVVKGDSIKLSQILNNLIGNAIKFTDDGNVSLNVSLIERTDKGFRIQFQVKDTGIGISKEKLEHIFDPFHQANKSITRKYGGTGLGLSIVKNLVELQQGKINVKSKESEGSTFSAILPFEFAESKNGENVLPKSHINDLKWKLNLKVLYVEDVTTNQYLIQEVLKDWGVKVELASDGYEAIEKMKSHPYYDVILMDIQMPGLDGYQTTKAIRDLEGEYYTKVPIIALTASSSESTRKIIKKSGIQDFVIKPVNARDLKDKLILHTKLKDQIDPTALVEKENNTTNEVTSSVSFDKTDKLFLNNTVRYQDFLKKTIEEFDASKDEMIYALEHKNTDQFRQVHHKMKSMISTLSLHDLSSVIEGIKKQLNSNNNSLDVASETENLMYQIDHVKDCLTNKLSSLKWY